MSGRARAFGDDVWNAFLGHMANMPIAQVCRMPGMPSHPTFVAKRGSDPEFDRRAAAITLKARGFRTGTGGKIPETVWDTFFDRLRTMPVHKVAKMPDMPSLSSYSGRCLRDPAFRARAEEVLKNPDRVAAKKKRLAHHLAKQRAETDFVERLNEARAANRYSGETWEAFLAHLAVMPVAQIARQPGMPSQGSFFLKRQEDPEFAARARSTMRSRILDGYTLPFTEEMWAEYLDRLKTAGSMTAISKLPNMPAVRTVWDRRQNNAEFAAQTDAIILDLRRARDEKLLTALREKAAQRDEKAAQRDEKAAAALREKAARRERLAAASRKRAAKRQTLSIPLGESLQVTLRQNDLYLAVSRHVSKNIDPTARADIISDLMLAVLEDQVAMVDLPKAADEFRKRHFRMFAQFGEMSLDGKLGSDGDFSLLDMLDGDAAEHWERGATRAR